MLIAGRQSFNRKDDNQLPSTYVDTNGCHVNLNYHPTKDTSLEFEAKYVSATGGAHIGFTADSGGPGATDSNDYRFFWYQRSTLILFDIGTNRLSTEVSYEHPNSFTHICCGRNGLTVDGVDFTTEYWKSQSTQSQIDNFTAASSGTIYIISPDTESSIHLRYLKIYERDELTMFVYGLKDSNGQVCFFDTLSKNRFYPDSGNMVLNKYAL